MTEKDNVTPYNCPECGEDDQWQIQNRICSAAAFFNPQITHVECANCGYRDVADTEPVGEDDE
jgi:Zn ribbon nucleic-acid-binding protein